MATSTKEVFEKYKQELTDCLPMEDSAFLDLLKEKGLLSGDMREQLIKTAEKSLHFLDNIIQAGDDSSFIDLLAAMEESSCHSVKELSLKIKHKFFEVLSKSAMPDTDQNNQRETEQVDHISDIDTDQTEQRKRDYSPEDKNGQEETEQVDYSPDIKSSAYSTACDKLQEHYDKLIYLPVMDLLPSLFSKEVVNFDQKQRANVKDLHTEKMGYILDLIIDSLKAGVAIKYDNFLKVLKESKDLTANELVKSLSPPISSTTELTELTTSESVRTLSPPIAAPTDLATNELVKNLDDAVIQHYKKKYKIHTKFYANDKYALGQTREYIDLVFMHYKTRKTETLTRKVSKLQRGGNIDAAVHETYSLCEIFKVNSAFTFIFEGAPGIGKTMVAQQIAYEWANDNILTNIELLLLLHFRDPILQKVNNFGTLMQYCNASSCERYFAEKQGENLLVVFDGYDELPMDSNICSFFNKLLNRKILSCCSIVFTSRPHSTIRLHRYCDCKIEILGFSEKSRFNFLTKNKVPDKKIEEVKEFLENNLIINSLCYIPFNMESLLLLVLEKEDLPKTQTELTKGSISITISQHIKKPSNHVDINRQNLVTQIKHVMDSLAPLAFKLIDNQKMVFTETEINNAGCKAIKDDKNAFGLVQVVQFTDIETSAETQLYSFVHFSVQEYLAAHYLSHHLSIAQSFYLHHKFWDERYFGIWKMYTGITEGKEYALQHYLSGENYIKGGIRFLLGQEFPGVSKKLTMKKVKYLLLYQMLLEAPDSKIKESVSDVVKIDAIDLSKEELRLQEDVNILTYCIARSYITMNWVMIDLSDCKIGDEECSKIFQGLSLEDGRQKPVIQCLDLSNNYITFEKFSCKSNVYGSSAVIHRLNISGNRITNFKVLDNLFKAHKITDLIMSTNSQQIEDLEMLEITSMIKYLHLSYNHWPTLQWSLPSLPNLHTLDMSYCYFNEDDTLISVDNILPSLQELTLSHCHLSADATAKLFYAIPKTVKCLNLSHNQIDDRALASLQELFHHNDNLQKLHLVNTDLNGVNVLSCVQALKIGCMQLQTLDIRENDISDDEANSVIRLCHKIPSLKEVKLKDIHVTEHVLRHAGNFIITNYRNPIKRKVLVVGMKNTGKTTLITKLTNHTYHDTTTMTTCSKLSFMNYRPTAKIQEITEVLFINDTYYECTFIDTPGLTRKIIPILDDRPNLHSIDGLDLILFVFKHGENITKALSLFSDLLKADMKCSSASVITCCDDLTKENYESVLTKFISDPRTKPFCANGAYPIGFPDTGGMHVLADEIQAKLIQKNVSKLLYLIETSSDCISTNDVLKDQKCSVM